MPKNEDYFSPVKYPQSDSKQDVDTSSVISQISSNNIGGANVNVEF